jgi:DNA-binding transcriptional LysR family regulator
MNPSIRQLEAFSLVYKLGSVSKAADRMFISQSAVSVLLRQLETALDTRLFDRTTRSLQPTAAAHEALLSANRILQEVNRLSHSMKSLADKSHGRVHFAVTAALAASIFPSILRVFMERFPKVDVIIEDVPHDQLGRMLLDHEVEFSIGGPPGKKDPDLHYLPLINYVVSAIDLDDGNDSEKTIKWSELVGKSTIAIHRGGIRNLIDQTLTEHGLEFHPTFEVQFLSTALAMTAEGLGISIMPGYMCPPRLYPKFRVRHLVEPEILRQLMIVTRPDRSLSAAAEAFIEIARETLAREVPQIK